MIKLTMSPDSLPPSVNTSMQTILVLNPPPVHNDAGENSEMNLSNCYLQFRTSPADREISCSGDARARLASRPFHLLTWILNHPREFRIGVGGVRPAGRRTKNSSKLNRQ